MNATAESSFFSLDSVLYMLFRRKWLILLGIVSGCAAAAFVYLTAPEFFVSEAKLLVRYVTDDTSLDLGDDRGRVMRPDSRGSSILNSEAAILQSRNLAAEVVREVGVDVIFPPGEGAESMDENVAAAALLRSLKISVPRNSSIIHLAYQHPDPLVAQQILDRLIDHYLEAHQAIHSAAASYGFFAQKTDQLRTELRATENELQQLKQENGVVNIDEAKALLMARRSKIRDRLDEQQGLIASARARTALLREQLGIRETAPEAGKDADPEAVDLQERAEREQRRREWAVLRQRQLELLNRYSRESTPLKDLQRRIDEAERRLGSDPALVASAGAGTGSQPAAIADPGAELRRELILEESRIVSAQALTNLLAEQMEATEQEIADLNRNESRIVELERQREVEDSAYRRFAEALDVAKNKLALAPDQLSNITTVEPATLPIRPERPEGTRKLVVLAGGAGLGIFCGLALLLEMVGMQQLRRPVEIERVLNVPTLMTFPRAPAFKRPVALNGTQKLLPSPGTGDDEAPEIRRNVAEPLQPYFEGLLHRIQLSGALDGEIPHLIGVASCSEGAGTTTVAAGLAVTLSQQENAKTLLIDGDLGKGAAHEVLGISEATSLPRVLLDGAGASSRVQPGLYLLSAGNGEHKVARPSLGRRFRELVGFLKESKYTSVVLDLPPIHETSPTLQMAGLLDGVVLVMESEKVSRDRARMAVKMLTDANAKVVGVVLNKKRDYVPSWLDGGV